jgi:hypothetical protein
MIPDDAKICIGFDHAVSGRDESVAFVGALIPGLDAHGQEAIVLCEHEVRTWLNTLIYDQVSEITQLYPRASYCVDATAEGGKECLGYFERARVEVVGIDFGKAKQTLMIKLKNSMQRGLFRFNDERLRVQLSNYKFQESKTKKGHYRYGETGTPDDRVDAAALANYLAVELRGNQNLGFHDFTVYIDNRTRTISKRESAS